MRTIPMKFDLPGFYFKKAKDTGECPSFCAAPHWLVRLPYGNDQQPVESFCYEEQVAGHNDLLWGNPAFAVAAVFAEAFAESGWQMNPASSVARVSGLPLYVYDADGESATMPCAEVLIGEKVLEAFMGAGLLPLVSYRDADIVGMPSQGTLAHPRKPLRLVWG